MKIQNKIWKSILILFLVIYSILFLLDIIVDTRVHYFIQLETLVNNFWILGVILLLGIPFFVIIRRNQNKFRFLNNFPRKYFLVILCISSVLLFFVQQYIVESTYFMTGWDASINFQSAKIVAEGTPLGYAYYYSQYTNNVIPVFILSKIMSFIMEHGIGTDLLLSCIKVDCIIMSISALLTALCVRKLTKSHVWGYFSYLISIPMIILSPWILIPYTDSYSIFISVFIFYCYLICKDGSILRIFLWPLICLLGVTGYYMKPTSILIFIAIIMMEIINFIFHKEKRLECIYSLFFIIPAIFLAKALFTYSIDYIGLDFNEDIQLSPAHYFMMGLNNESSGGYHSPDYAFSCGTDDPKERQAKQLERAFSRIKEYGPVGLTKVYIEKLLYTFNDGSFSWGYEGGFYQDVTQRPTQMAQRLQSLYYSYEKNYPYLATFLQTLWLFVFGTMLGVSLKLKSLDEKIVTLLLGMVGIFFFALLFEARARYLLVNLPLFLITSTLGMQQIFERIPIKKKV